MSFIKICRKKILNRIKSLLSQLIGESTFEEVKTTEKEFGLKGFFHFIGGQWMHNTKTREYFRNTTSKLTNEITDLFNELVEIVENKTGKKIMVIVDDLEKVTNWKRIEEFLINDKQKAQFYFKRSQELQNQLRIIGFSK